MYILKIWRFVALLIVCTIIGQPFTKAQDGYTLVGSARSSSSPDCYQLTPARDGQAGAVWFDKPLRLTESFEIIFSLNFGTNVLGADGIALVFQTQGKQIIGGSGGGIGYNGIHPSLSIEFDTSKNFDTGDPAEDHIALVSDGVVDHRLNTNFAPPIPISAIQKSVKDGRDHNIKLSWDVNTQKLLIEVDCVTRITQTIDLVNNVFVGVSEVYWGFTAATGSATNAHTVCIKKNTELPDTVRACRNDLITLTAPLSSNSQYEWSPATNLDNYRTRSPHLKVTDSRLYTVQYIDPCGQSKLDSIFVKAKGVALSIGDDRQVCENGSVILIPMLMPANVPVTYRWSTGQTTAQLKPTTSGQYSLTITADGCSVSDSAKVTFMSLPKLSLSTEPVYDCPGDQSIQLDPAVTGANLQYFWTPGTSKEPTLMANAPGMYAVQITADMGCSVIQRFTILDNCPSIVLFVPDVFTPNGDGVNDVLTWKSESDLDASMKVFDRWGEALFISTVSSPYWDGTYRGKLCPPDAYTWSLEYWPRLATKKSGFTRQGKVLLLR